MTALTWNPESFSCISFQSSASNNYILKDQYLYEKSLSVIDGERSKNAARDTVEIGGEKEEKRERERGRERERERER